MSTGDHTLDQHILDLLIQFQKAHSIGNSNTALCHTGSDLFLCKIKLPDQLLISQSFFDRI